MSSARKKNVSPASQTPSARQLTPGAAPAVPLAPLVPPVPDASGTPEPAPPLPSAEDVVGFVRCVLNNGPCPQWRHMPAAWQRVPGLVELHGELWALRELTMSLARGETQQECVQRGYVIGGLKAIQASLRHLTWQVQRVAMGEYIHKVEGLGEFSSAFNHMTEQLRGTVEELYGLTEKYKRMSRMDVLTSALNRFGFMEEAQRELNRARRRVAPMSLIVADLDFFKRVNDTYGHRAGDEVLCAFVSCLRKHLRDNDRVGRMGGEEFSIMLPDTPLDAALLVAERLRQAVQDMTVEVDGTVLRVTVSLGLTVIDAGDMEGLLDKEVLLMDALDRADQALYSAKQNGRNRVVVHGAEM